MLEGTGRGGPSNTPGLTGNTGKHMLPKLRLLLTLTLIFPFRLGWEVMYGGTTSQQ